MDSYDLSQYSHRAVLRDGTPVLIRAIRPDDTPGIEAAFQKLTPEAVYSRFFSFKKELSADDLGRLVDIDFVSAVVLVAVAHPDAGGSLIGGVSCYVRDADDGSRIAEIAFSVVEDHWGKGLSGLLLSLLAGVARSRGIARFEAEVLSSNVSMLTVFRRSGLPMTQTSDEGVVHVVLDLRPSGPAP